MMKKVLLLLISTSLIFSAHSQFPLKGNFKRVSFDVYGGIPMFHGDTKNKFGDMTYTFTGRLNYNLTSAFTLGAEFSYGSMKGEDTDSNTDLAYFHNRYMKTIVGVDVHLFNVLHFDQISRFFQPFVGLGFGAIKSDMEGSGRNNIEDDFQYNDWAFGHQFNVGAKFKLSKTFDFNIRYSKFFANVDMIDNYDEPVHANRHNDAFSELNIGFTMHFGKKGNEPIIWRNSEECCIKNQEEDENKLKETSLSNDSIFDLLAKQDSTNKALNQNLLDLEQKLNSFEDEMTVLSENAQKNQTQNNNNGSPLNDLDDKTFRLENGNYMYIGELKGDISAEYYVIIGSYRLKSNAKRDQQNWKDKGFETYLMMEINKGLYRVVIDYSDDHTEALKLLKEYKEKLNKESWMIKTSTK